MEKLKVEILLFEDKYTTDFAELNFEWLRKYFYIEEYDRKVLQNPSEYILKPGGQILFARVNDKIVGTVALINREEEGYELSKMAVTEEFKGLRIGQKLMYACLDYAGQAGINRVFLDSNRKLTPALRLYEKVGFKEIPVPTDTPYERCDIRMELYL
ncbi:MAG: GNAT family N-acetyltransferase [Flavobacteriales bacterium]|nr:GNAT family N-acetyltransferase [Flavobacteriales bacterium]